ncbi:hypothetical protein RJ639_032273 [Escallonia herrerae]|uniref:Myb/SANT-like DNA-binding domain-containing protein n=1 Tax=Escallonia herrerae TaxID=1293975 RepID=A0AA88X1R5_9ASTE|nr:hypothetical protein RJ639_032273 [Escallonia herrerae]
MDHQSTFPTSSRSKRPVRNQPYPIPTPITYHNEQRYAHDEYEEEDDDELDQETDEFDDEDQYENGFTPKKRKVESLVSKYEFLPRAGTKQSVNVGDSRDDWSEHASFVLLEVWGDKFMELGRKSLRSEEWNEAAEKVSEMINAKRTQAQCRNRLDALKKKYRKEKAKAEETGGGYYGKWAYFKKMDMLLNSSNRQQCGMACGVDSGEYVFMNPRRSRSQMGMEEEEEEEDEGSFRLLADSVQKFGEIYEKIEGSKRQQMVELEKMRMDFQRDLELQKKQILERAHAEIAKIRQGEDDETDVSAENLSG